MKPILATIIVALTLVPGIYADSAKPASRLVRPIGPHVLMVGSRQKGDPAIDAARKVAYRLAQEVV